MLQRVQQTFTWFNYLLMVVKIDSQAADRYQRVLLEGSINTNSLVEGNNELRMTYEENGGACKRCYAN